MPGAFDADHIIDPGHYQRHGYPYETFRRLRREDPVHRCEPAGIEPFWAVTRHADICEISRQPGRFSSATRPVIFLEGTGVVPAGSAASQVRPLVMLDPPEHREHRFLASPWFKPRTIRHMEERVTEVCRGLLDALAKDGGEGECDFVAAVAAPAPLRMIAEMLGVPEQDEPILLRLTNELFGAQDAEFKRGADAQQSFMATAVEIFGYFAKLFEERRQAPRDDLLSVMAHEGRIGGQPVSVLDAVSLCFIIATAGHETTRNAISGGLLALIEHPGEWKRLHDDPRLLDTAVDEIIRWTSPVVHFARTATGDYELRGRRIAKGDTVALFYPSANRDEEVFGDPDSFRVDRAPNPHLAFGIGEHFCLGTPLARLELRILFGQLLTRLEHAELAGAPERLRASLVSGLKHLPLRYRLTPRPFQNAKSAG
jgi:cytochrome P450